MAKSGKKAQEEHPKGSVLRAAWEAWQRGDTVEARRLAAAVVAGARGPDDDHVALDLAKEFSIEGAVVNGTPADVAREMLVRSVTPPRAYAFAILSMAIFVTLTLLAAFRYAP